MLAFTGLWRRSNPAITIMHGYCGGGGLELALCIDLVVASNDARFDTPYSRLRGFTLPTYNWSSQAA